MTEDRFRYYTPRTKAAILYIEALPDVAVLTAARSTKSVAFTSIWDRLGRETNPNWITGRCAETAYSRGLIDEREFDFLSD